MDKVLNEVNGWVQAPFTSPVDLWNLFLLSGLVLVFIMVWMMILYHIRIASQGV